MNPTLLRVPVSAGGPQRSTEPVEALVHEVLAAIPFIDIHTHLFPAAFTSLVQWGIDNLLTYHYLEAELFRFSPIRPHEYWGMSKTQRADLIWRTLFRENTPISESTRGVIAALHALGVDTNVDTLAPLRDFFAEQTIEEYIPRVFDLAGVSSVVMTNDPLDANESLFWSRKMDDGPRFRAALRLDRILNEWSAHAPILASHGYAVGADGSSGSVAEVRRFVTDWAHRMEAVYMAVSLPDSFQFPAEDIRTRLVAGAILPACRDLNIPLSLMLGVRRQVNPALRLAGDASGKADLRSIESLCQDYPDNRFLVSVLSRENQHELCVYARKFRNLMPFGCWWFLNNPSIVEEITRERIEMLGASFIPQHSDARVLEQLIYKWRNTRRTLAPVLARSYQLLEQDGRPVTREDIVRDVTRLLRTNFEHWIQDATTNIRSN